MSDRVHSSVGALQALGRSLTAFRTGFEASSRNVERSLVDSCAEADDAVARRRRDLEEAIAEHQRAEAERREAEAEESAARADLANAQGQDPRYRGSAVARAQQRLSRARGLVDAAEAREREAERKEHRCRQLKERCEAARTRINSALTDYRSSASAARAAETSIALTAMSKISILKDVLNAYLSSSGSARRAGRSSTTSANVGADTAGFGATGSGDEPSAVSEDAVHDGIDWARFGVDIDLDTVQLLSLAPEVLTALGGEELWSGAAVEADPALPGWADRWINGGSAMFRRDPSPDNFDARDLRDGLSGDDSYRSMFDCMTASPVVIDAATGRPHAGLPLLKLLVERSAEVIPIRFERTDNDD